MDAKLPTWIKCWNGGLIQRRLPKGVWNIYLKQIFEFGYFHADPHPGNILIQKNGVICLIDFGMTGKLLKRDKLAFAGILLAHGQ